MNGSASDRPVLDETPSPQMQAVLARIAALRTGQGDRYAMPFAESRAQLLRERQWWLEGAPPMARVSDEWLNTDAGTIRIRQYQPEDGLRAESTEDAGPIVYLHGGGWCVGSIDTHDGVIRHLARACGRTAIGIDYPLAPESPFPAALDAIDAVLAKLAAAGRLNGDWAFAGDSAGAHLALLLTLAARRRPAPATWTLPGALLLFYGVYYPIRPTASLRRFGGGAFGLSTVALERYQAAFLAGRSADRVAEAFVRNDDLRDPEGRHDCRPLPPIWLAAAALDPLRDDTLDLADALTAVGANHRLRIYAGVIHGFLSYTRMLEPACTAFTDAATFMAGRPAPGPGPAPR